MPAGRDCAPRWPARSTSAGASGARSSPCRGAARSPPDTEQRIADFTELAATAIANTESRAELVASRARIVAAFDRARRVLERDLHDGVQQRLVSLALTLRGAQKRVPAGRPELDASLSQAAEGLAEVLSELQEISRGIHPAILSQGGLVPALKALARRAAVPVELAIRAADGCRSRSRWPPITSSPRPWPTWPSTLAPRWPTSTSTPRDGALHLRVRDDGVGGADPVRGSGLIGLNDRVEALGGTMRIDSPAGKGTSLLVTLPIGQRLASPRPGNRAAQLPGCAGRHRHSRSAAPRCALQLAGIPEPQVAAGADGGWLR